ncbi:hypothetical protein K2173_002203 [Erythroxylum novogranatense]|uniref:Carboxypeptidase n=1 Tax=Erythroxylum novogranatense TaxID=1862640 RepID=A0AAV8TTQ0_9ROSI|nr:hypothetical protein K2173_002203 [Erythroxylum novogranatense]
MESTTTVSSSFHHFTLLLFLCFLHYQTSLVQSALPIEALPTKSGYLPVDPTSNSAIFYTFYEAQNSTSPLPETPLLIWLQGGPGCSSMIGNFLELGPYRVVDPQKPNTHQLPDLQRNPGSWNRIFGLVFLDNPVGVGFSIASKPDDIPRDQHSVAIHLFAAIKGFLELDPVFKNRPLYITGESYAGKYVPAIGYHILNKNKNFPVSEQVNLKGVAIGNGITDPVTQVQTHAANAYYSGLINERQKGQLEEVQRKAVRLIEMGKWTEATETRNEVFHMLSNFTGLATLFDYTKKEPYKTYLVINLLQSNDVKKGLGANESTVFDDCSDVVEAALHGDVMKSVKYIVELLVKESKVLLYQGLYDLRDSAVSVEAWVKTMKWDGIERFLMAERKIWKVEGELAGYVQKGGSLSHAVVLGAGHLVPADQSVNSQAMIENWVLETGVFADKQVT